MDYKWVTECRVCGSSKLRKYLDLGKQPLANALLPSKDSAFKKYPLQVLFCESCYLSQLSVVVNPETLYSDYPYHSSVSETFKKHCRDMALTIKGMFRTLEGKPLVVDVASNDGCLLEQFSDAGYYVMGVEPCKKLAKESRAKGISTINEFFSKDLVPRIPACDVITATNVLAHVDDVRGFVNTAKKLLRVHSKGIMVVEVPYLANLISGNQFDTIYHEHLSYFLLKPLRILFASCGVPIFRVEQPKIHGGSLRIYASPYDRREDASVKSLEAWESAQGLHKFTAYKNYAKKVSDLRDSLLSLLDDLKQQKKKVVGYGASAKGAMLMNYCGINSSQIHSVVDDTKAKQGKIIPGCGIKVVSGDHFDTNHPDYIALLSWNFSDELKKKTRHLKAKYITPIPQVSIS